MPLFNVQFDCSADNEVVQNALKSFAKMLVHIFEQHKKVWTENLKLRKYCEDVAINIPLNLLELKKCNDDNINLDTSRSSCDSISKYVFEVASNSKEDASKNESDQKVKVVTASPILLKKRLKPRRMSITGSDDSSLKSSEKGIVDMYVPVKENISILQSSFKEDIVPEEVNENIHSTEENKDFRLNCKTTAITPIKIGISKIYNVDTTLLKNGKKLKQTKIVFNSDNRSMENVGVKRHLISTPLKTKAVEEYQDVSSDTSYMEEDVIDSSLVEYTEPNLKLRSLKPKCSTFPTSSKKENISKSHVFKAANQSSLSQYLLPKHTSTHMEQLPLITKSKTFAFQNIYQKSTCNIPHVSPTRKLFDDQHADFNSNECKNVLDPNKLEKAEKPIDACTEKKIYLQNKHEIFNSPETCNDETFCLLGEELKENISSYTCKEDSSKGNINHKLSKASSVKRALMDSFDMPPKKIEKRNEKLSKKKADRAKMDGVSCWECEKYYNTLGLSEEEKRLRQNQCSRHRTNYKKRERTPEGFWDPVFPDTSSTYMGN